MLRLASLTIAAGIVAAAALPAAADSYTTRIEPRPFYGATVTLEEGVRVFRPLPPTRHVIINPQGRTPLSLHQSDVRVIEERTINNNNYGSGDSASGGRHGGLYAPYHGAQQSPTSPQGAGRPVGAR